MKSFNNSFSAFSFIELGSELARVLRLNWEFEDEAMVVVKVGEQRDC